MESVVGTEVLSFRVTQILTGHGYFNTYLYKIGATNTAECAECGAREDTVQHVVAECLRFTLRRNAFQTVTGTNLSPVSIIGALLDSADTRNAVKSFCEEVNKRQIEIRNLLIRQGGKAAEASNCFSPHQRIRRAWIRM